MEIKSSKRIIKSYQAFMQLYAMITYMLMHVETHLYTKQFQEHLAKYIIFLDDQICMHYNTYYIHTIQ